MTETLDTLTQLLMLERLEENLFRGISHDLGYSQLFGGQLLGQALSAASQTVLGERLVHSLHGYFLRPGDAHQPLIYQVERIRDGHSFSARRIGVIQKGQLIFTGMASFQRSAEGFEHQYPMPEVPGPEGLATDLELIQQWARQVPKKILELRTQRKALEIRPVGQQNPIDPRPQEPFQHLWLRATDLVASDHQMLHRCLLAYASDFFLVSTTLLPHAAHLWQPNLQLVSLDHALWFHRQFRADDWLLYSLESPWTGQTRGLARGHFFNRQGQLVASVTQEGLLRRIGDTHAAE